MSGAKLTVAIKKLRALEGGALQTDCVFLVGDEQNVQEVHACKADLKVVSSLFFKERLSSHYGPCEYFKLKNIEPQVFKLVAEFAHLCGQLVTEVDSLDLCLKLAAAADEYMIEDLSAQCSKLLEDRFLSVENVWAVLSENLLINATTSSCLKLLSFEAKKCVQHKTFLEAREEAIEMFLTLDQMNIDCELELVKACLYYAKSTDDERATFRRFCPRLRLLALKFSDLQNFVLFLTNEEKTYLAALKNPLLRFEELKLNESIICTIPFERGPHKKILTLIGDDYIDDIRTIFKKAKWEKITSLIIFKITLIAKRCIKILGFDVLCKLDIYEEDYFGEFTSKMYYIRVSESHVKSKSILIRLEEAGHKSYNNNLNGQYTVSINGSVFKREINFPKKLEKNSWAHIDLCAFVPEGCRVEFKVEVLDPDDNPIFLRKLPLADDLSKINQRDTINCFSDILLRSDFNSYQNN
ncbi:Hypothetical predicted protein [Cloeon dipterum]|uniref:BTB domain-containing protein n=1 Tax=Cloeon dipterum TaxID=197152 RepID=A0A8S1CIL8_9INSE|nr:Hypothetical predicted protein [Cloeon dipterum]